jgi:hypothetical protein
MQLDREFRLEGYTFKTFLDITTTHYSKEAFVHLEIVQCYTTDELQNCKLISEYITQVCFMLFETLVDTTQSQN